jgi:hypothetical protein
MMRDTLWSWYYLYLCDPHIWLMRKVRAKRAFWQFKAEYYLILWSLTYEDLCLFVPLRWMIFRQAVRLHPQTVLLLALVWPVLWMLTHH